MNLVALNFIESGVVTADKEAVRHFKADDRRKRRTNFGENRKLTDAFHNLINRVDCRLLAAQLVGNKLGLICGRLLELSRLDICEMEAKLEVSILEFYYSAKSFFYEYEKGSVCGKVAILNFSDYEKVS